MRIRNLENRFVFVLGSVKSDTKIKDLCSIGISPKMFKKPIFIGEIK